MHLWKSAIAALQSSDGLREEVVNFAFLNRRSQIQTGQKRCILIATSARKCERDYWQKILRIQMIDQRYPDVLVLEFSQRDSDRCTS